ncbi:DNA repair protein RecO [Staphylococcus sp. SQ8-PEA]|uniref:DNA repair protein RecO n=1 Tax=Staphylococcus marylandisciuri TaxID=2981529 RepID=A0ABT2QQX7_9STAP|nr:DNA repair protein RecO [Staphylococcus marylandisciuri]MCU5746385.1 DNA repair protein RecO [Staphylococcus marylandisciuri]
MLIKQKGIIIKSVDYGESDKIITILNEHGAKIPLLVRRAKKSNSSLQADTQPFVFGLFIFSRWKGMGTLSSVDVINQNFHLRLDIYESSYASLCVETIDRSIEDDEVSQYSYQLLSFALEKMSEGISAQLMSVIVLLKCMPAFGFNASFNQCAVSGQTEQSALCGYSFKYDGAISEAFLSEDPHAVRLSNKTLYLLYVLQSLPIDKMDGINIKQQLVDEMSELMMMLYREYAGMFFKSQKLINQLRRLDS